MSKRITRQQQYDLQALESLKSRMPLGSKIEGSVVTLPVPPGTPVEKLAAVSIRVSKGRDKMISPEIQWDTVMPYCKHKRLVPYKVFLDMHKTGREFEKRAVGQMCEDVKSGHYKNVILWKWSRWGRNVRWSSVYLASVEEAGGEVRSASEDIDPKTAIGKFTRTQLLALAELESDLKAESWKAAHDNRRQRALPHSGLPRYGYDYDTNGGGYTVNEDERAVVSDLYQRYNAGITISELARAMNARGLLTRTNAEWVPTSLGRMLDTGFAAGLIRERSNPPTSANNKQGIAVFDIWREGSHEPIIDMETWETYKAKRLVNSKIKSKHAIARTHLLSGFLMCGECGGTLISQYNNRKRHHNWTCGKRVQLQQKGRPAATLHPPVNIKNELAVDVVRRWIDEQAEGGEDMQAKTQREVKALGAVKSNVDNLKARVESLKQERRGLSRQLAKSQIDEDDFEVLKAEVDEQMEDAVLALNAALATSASGNVARADWQSLTALWDQASPVELRALLEQVSSAVVVRAAGRSSADSKVFPVPLWD